MTKTSFLRKVAKMLVACLAVVVMFVACDKDNGNGSNGNNSNKTNGTGWPPSEVRDPYGLRDMSQPTGASEITWGNYGALTIYFKGTNATNSAIVGWFANEKWNIKTEEHVEGTDLYHYVWKKGEYGVFYVYNYGNIQFNAGKDVN